MLVTLEEMKNYLRVDYDDDDSLIEMLIASARRICMDILRVDDESLFLKSRMQSLQSCTALHIYMNTEKKLTITLLPLLFVHFYSVPVRRSSDGYWFIECSHNNFKKRSHDRR